ncbi:hypothetical protein IAU59_002738 [Kwoniella sp. CBS 9459]
MSSEGASSSKSGKVKSGRTPEQQAARDARKAAKAAAKAAADTPSEAVNVSATEGEPQQAESTSTAEPEVGNPDQQEGESSKKRKRVQVVPEGEELEIDVGAPAPLSKAELRAQKKRLKRGDGEPEKPVVREYEKPSKVAPKDQHEDGEEGADGGKAVGPGGKRQNSVWVGNLAFKTTVETLTDFFQRGITELGGQGAGCVTRINMPKKNGKGGYAENKGFAYVDFVTPEIQELAVALSERPYEGRRLLIKKGDDHTAQPTARTPKPLSTKAEDLGASSSKRPETSSLYFGNLPFDATEQGLRDLVEGNAAEREGAELDEGAENIGERGGKKSGLKKVRLGAFEDTGRCKGFAFLDFLSSRHAKSALANRKNHYYGGRKLTVEFASEAAAQRSGGRSKPRIDAPKPRKFYNAPDADAGADGEAADAGAGAGPGGAGRGAGEGDEPKRNDKRGKKWEVTGRPRPGAALAMAKRENVAIVEGAGQKITFD